MVCTFNWFSLASHKIHFTGYWQIVNKIKNVKMQNEMPAISILFEDQMRAWPIVMIV